MRRLLFITLLVLTAKLLNAQYYNPDISSRYFVGGAAGLTLGSYTNIEFSPMIGVNINPRFSVSASFVYMYSKLSYNNYNIEGNIIGSRLASEFVILHKIYDFIPLNFIDNLFAHAEYEYLSISQNNNGVKRSVPVDNFLYGGGISSPIGKKSMLKFNILTTTANFNYPFSIPVIRFDLCIYIKKALPRKYLEGMD